MLLDHASEAAFWFADWIAPPRDMDATSVALLTLPVIGLFVVIVHELGHAVAAHARRLPIERMRIGSAPDLRMRIGGRTVEVGRPSITGWRGFVEIDLTKATSTDALITAVAGPAASLMGAAVTAALAGAIVHPHWLGLALRLATMSGVVAAAFNMIPGSLDGRPTDGRRALSAWRARRDHR